MKHLLWLLFASVLVPAGHAEPVMGDYDAELRDATGHVDTDRMVKRLVELGANTYMWLIWHKPTDWEDLQAFLPKAEEAKIKVWAYIVPWTESGYGGLYSDPYRTDFVRWAQEIGKLSLDHPNLVGYVIDDFWANFRPQRFTPQYVAEMVAAGKAVNPGLKFYPLMYFPEIALQFSLELAPLVDGVVVAYPQSRAQIERALTFLNDAYMVPERVTLTYPSNTPSKPGDHLLLSQTATVEDAETAKLSFRLLDSFDGPTAGYHFMQVRVDDTVVWSEDVEGTDEGEVTVDLREAVRGKTAVRLALGVHDEKGVSQFPVLAMFSNLRLMGLSLERADLGQVDGWEQSVEGAFTCEFGPRQTGEGKFHCPMIVMPAGSRGEYKHRYNEEATPERIVARTSEALEMAVEKELAGKVEGVVMYCLDKSSGSPDFEAMKALFTELRVPEEVAEGHPAN